MPCGTRNPTTLARISIDLDRVLEELAGKLTEDLDRHVSKAEASRVLAGQNFDIRLPPVQKKKRGELRLSGFVHL